MAAPHTVPDLLLGAKAGEALGTLGKLEAGKWYFCPTFNQVFEFIAKAKGGYKEGKTVFDLDSCIPGATDISQPGEDYRCKQKEADYFLVDKDKFQRKLDQLSFGTAEVDGEPFARTFPGLFDAIFSSSMTNSQLKNRANEEFLHGRVCKAELVEAFLKTAAKRHTNNEDRKGFASIEALSCGDVKGRLHADERRCESEWVALLHGLFQTAEETFSKANSTPAKASPSGAAEFPPSSQESLKSQTKPTTGPWWLGTNPSADVKQDLRPMFEEQARIDAQAEENRREMERLQELERIRLQYQAEEVRRESELLESLRAEEASRREAQRLQRLEQVRVEREAEEARWESERLKRVKKEANRKDVERLQQLELNRSQREAMEARRESQSLRRRESESLRRTSFLPAEKIANFFNQFVALILAIAVGFLLWEFFFFSLPNFLKVDEFLHLGRQMQILSSSSGL